MRGSKSTVREHESASGIEALWSAQYKATPGELHRWYKWAGYRAGAQKIHLKYKAPDSSYSPLKKQLLRVPALIYTRGLRNPKDRVKIA